MPYRKVTYLEQMWYLLKFRIKEVLTAPKKKRGKCGK